MTALTQYVDNIGRLPKGKPDDLTFRGVPVYESKYCPKDKVYRTETHIVVNTIDPLLMLLLIAEVRDDARKIVRTGLADVLEWLGEKP